MTTKPADNAADRHRDDVALITKACRTFYESISDRDFDRMSSVWEPSVRSTCVHPGQPVQRGWNQVANSWAALLEGPPRNQFILSDATITIEGDLAWVVLHEDIIDSTGPARTVASINVLARHGEQWLFVCHHGSTVQVHPDGAHSLPPR
jgi:ketosteroid isomerase-like protein